MGKPMASLDLSGTAEFTIDDVLSGFAFYWQDGQPVRPFSLGAVHHNVGRLQNYEADDSTRFSNTFIGSDYGIAELAWRVFVAIAPVSCDDCDFSTGPIARFSAVYRVGSVLRGSFTFQGGRGLFINKTNKLLEVDYVVSVQRKEGDHSGPPRRMHLASRVLVGGANDLLPQEFGQYIELPELRVNEFYACVRGFLGMILILALVIGLTQPPAASSSVAEMLLASYGAVPGGYTRREWRRTLNEKVWKPEAINLIGLRFARDGARNHMILTSGNFSVNGAEVGNTGEPVYLSGMALYRLLEVANGLGDAGGNDGLGHEETHGIDKKGSDKR
ncbi:hypothetical protein GcM1_164002 [Golovinomyces cichoracearum]|uniref:Uncharacterized protein n=1 Tax=Golovinomyces cichoracearum TaxID=62708 RepID=A0A420J884_9PEZI|nr:hypothetical protein GcM1_164002 [Golovinomyces cichoracearum]